MQETGRQAIAWLRVSYLRLSEQLSSAQGCYPANRAKEGWRYVQGLMHGPYRLLSCGGYSWQIPCLECCVHAQKQLMSSWNRMAMWQFRDGGIYELLDMQAVAHRIKRRGQSLLEKCDSKCPKNQNRQKWQRRTRWTKKESENPARQGLIRTRDTSKNANVLNFNSHQMNKTFTNQPNTRQTVQDNPSRATSNPSYGTTWLPNDFSGHGPTTCALSIFPPKTTKKIMKNRTNIFRKNQPEKSGPASQ